MLPFLQNPQAFKAGYRGRLAPTPTGFLHAGHGRTFRVAAERAAAAAGVLLLRVEDLDAARCRREYREALFEDLRWLGLRWDEGPDVGGPCGPYEQSARLGRYRQAWRWLIEAGRVYPCVCSRRDVATAAVAPHAGEDEPVYPGTCRDRGAAAGLAEAGVNWRFRVPDGREMVFRDGRLGEVRAVAGKDFGDFLVWRRDGVPSYQLAVVADDLAMGITEVVRGEDLVRSTFRQLLLYEAFGAAPPAFYHCELARDGAGRRLSKRDGALSLRALRAAGVRPEAAAR